MVSAWLNTSEIIYKNAKKPCHRLGWCPYGKLVEEFPMNQQTSEFNCKVFYHDCPIFYHIEYTSEKYGKEDYETEVEILFNKGGLSEVFSDDKIAEYWYNIGSEHSDDDNILKLQYAIEKLILERPNQKEIVLKLKEIIQSVSVKEIYK
ncbi:hypothetical protein LCGC14_0998130 [marine sediment metagenome]|uniref:Uncharacterized protein n=1 Tax=marine sediment metagenome TaxID=412755 RepID=A0A0F9N8I8_9ZZZZ|nr:MAG: hypothetical protein Lokiarch_08330 [Candidatus Lokiarchaeum sp. GC14_75]